MPKRGAAAPIASGDVDWDDATRASMEPVRGFSSELVRRAIVAEVRGAKSARRRDVDERRDLGSAPGVRADLGELGSSPSDDPAAERPLPRRARRRRHRLAPVVDVERRARRALHRSGAWVAVVRPFGVDAASDAVVALVAANGGYATDGALADLDGALLRALAEDLEFLAR